MKWTEEEINFISRNYKDHTVNEMSEALENKRSEQSIRWQIRNLGLKKKEKLEPLDKNNKVCSKCKTEKPRNEFSASKKSKDGLLSWCKSCRNEYEMLRANDEKLKKKKAEVEAIRNKTANEIKRCTKCGELKKGSEFYFLYSRKVREAQCIECSKKRKNENKIEGIKKGKDW